MPFPCDFRKLGRNLAIPLVVGYVMHLTVPKEQHFRRYVEERRKFEPDFCTRMEHPSCKSEYEDCFVFARVSVESCGFRQQQVNGFGVSHGIVRWRYIGVLNNFWWETRVV